MASNSRFQILIPDRLEPPADIEQAVFGELADFHLPVAAHTSEISDEVWAKADAVLAWHDLIFDRDVIQKLKNCKVIVRVGVGYDNISLKAAEECGILVCNVPDYGTEEVADHAMALMLSLSRGLTTGNDKARKDNANWTWQNLMHLRRLSTSTLGIIGLGRIGTAVALRAKSFGLRVMFYDPYLKDGVDKAIGITRCYQLAELLERSDIVSLHAPLTPETCGMANQAFFGQMKPDSLFINTARGAIADLDAMSAALRTDRLRGIGIDVLETEPPDRSHPFIQAWANDETWLSGRLIITPHAAFMTREAFIEMRRKAAEEARRVLLGELPRNKVTG